MKLSLFSDYALRTLMYATLKDGPFLLDDVAAAYRVSRNHLTKVVHSLAKLGYLETQRGRGGGIKLALPADQIRIGSLVRKTEDQPVIIECFDPATSTCPITSTCRLKGVLAEAMRAFYDTLDRYTLRDITTGRHRTKMRDILLPTPPA